MFMVKPVLTLVLFGWNIASIMACTEMQVLPSRSAPGSAITLSCKTDIEVKQIAAEISGKDWNATFPYLYDDGTNGDEIKNDNTYSLTLTAPAMVGTYQVKFYRVLPDQTELESEPFTFEVK
jgi:hypothetical protein